MKIIFKDLGLIEYEKFLKIQDSLTPLNENIVLFATHYPVYTVSLSEYKNFPFAVPVKRGGSITYFDEGTLMVYFIFNVKNPPYFFKKIRKITDMFLQEFAIGAVYDKTKPGYYIQNRKLISMGFSYIDGRSNHGISIHINPDLENFNKINPCNLSGIKATSLYNEGIKISTAQAKNILKEIITEVFDETQNKSSGV